MTLRRQIIASPETLYDFTAAADTRCRDSQRLLVAGHFSGAVYLAGFACEMWLKLAAIRCHDRRAGPTSPVASYLSPIRLWMAAHFPGVPHEAYHSLMFWSEYIIRFRSSSGDPLPALVAGELRHHATRRLFNDWKIDLRYRAIPVSDRHAWRVHGDMM